MTIDEQLDSSALLGGRMPVVAVSGDATARGHQHGEALRDGIAACSDMPTTDQQHGRRANIWNALLLVLLLAVSLPVLVITSSETAEAVCKGFETPDPVWRSYGKENANSANTCDANGFYVGKVKDTKTDGRCVDVRIRVPDIALIPPTGFVSQATACTRAWKFYNYNQVDTWLEENGEQDRDVLVCKAGTYICRYDKIEEMYGF